MRDFPFLTYDVFTETPFGGNPLAVFPDARGIDPAMFQTIAREFNLSETTFVTPVEGAPLRRRVRIFTPTYELPFAGHPTVGTAVALAELGAFSWPRFESELAITLEEEAGSVPVTLERRPGRALHATLTAPRLPERGPDGPDAAGLARVLGLAADRLSPTLRPASWSSGVRFCCVPLRDADALASIALDLSAWRELMAEAWAKPVYAFALDDPRRGREIRARMFAPSLGMAEDPATGAAAVATAGYLAEVQELPREGTASWIIRQGEEMGRPSRLALEADFAGGKLTAVRLGGSAVRMTQGALRIAAAG
jgi:trans-2,3-dihydro-3-hydroxyanthranilate isomerase